MSTDETNNPPKATQNEADLIPNESQSLAREFIDFIKYNKAWWMTPIIIVLILMVAVILLADSSPVLPFIYTVI